MREYVLGNETAIRAGFFLGMFIAVAIWEQVSPRRVLTVSKGLRWLSNLGIVFFNTFLLRLLFPLMAVGMAVLAEKENWGILNNVELNSSVSFFLTVLFFDLTIYAQHRIVHAVPLLWRIHRVHHTDLDYDVTTGSRFHPIEIIFSMIIKMLVVVTVGASPMAVLFFEVLLNAAAMFNHGNIYIPLRIERLLRFLIVTPDMHRVHHSIKPNETNSNFSFNFPWWDRIFGAYLAQPEGGHQQMTVGFYQFRELKHLQFHWLLKQPFLRVQRPVPPEKSIRFKNSSK